jgi:hypothetical protein
VDELKEFEITISGFCDKVHHRFQKHLMLSKTRWQAASDLLELLEKKGCGSACLFRV